MYISPHLYSVDGDNMLVTFECRIFGDNTLGSLEAN